MTQNKRFFLFVLALASLYAGFLVYCAHRSNIIFFTWLNFFGISEDFLISLKQISRSAPYYLLRAKIAGSIPDGLWVASGVLFLRVVFWDDAHKAGKWVAAFLAAAFSGEFLQISNGVRGTFDVQDLVYMAAGALCGIIILHEGVEKCRKERRIGKKRRQPRS